MPNFIPLPVGTLLENRYKLIEDCPSNKTDHKHLLGSGSFGAVYLAHDLSLNCEVAVKQAIFLNNKNSQIMFKREAQFLANLTHLSLPKVSRFFSDKESCFIVMDLIRGDDLEERVRKNGKLPFSEVREIAVQLFEVLEYLHSHSIIHKDIKPANLKFTSNGQLKLLDFGFAKGSVGLMSEHKETIIKGLTAAYAPPEQLENEPTTAQSDLYSASATLFYLATGLIPPAATVRATEIAIYGKDVMESPDKMNTGIPEWFADAINEGMSLSTEKRPLSAAAMRERLENELLPVKPQAILEESQSDSSEDEVFYFERGNKWLHLNGLSTAIKNFNKAIELKPDYAEAYDARGLAYSNKGDFDQAIADYSRAIELQPDFLRAYYHRATVYKELGEKEKLKAERKRIAKLRKEIPFVNLKNFEKFITFGAIFLIGISVLIITIYFFSGATPSNYTADDYLRLGKECLNRKSFDCAIENYTKSIELKPDYADAYFYRGAVYENQSNYDLAIKDYGKAIELEPNYSTAYYYRGHLYLKKNYCEQAEKDFAAKARLYNNDLDYFDYYDVGSCYYEKNQYSEALINFDKTITLKKDYASAYFYRGLIYLDQNKDTEAIANFDEYIKFAPDDAGAYYNRALAYSGNEKYDEAIADYTKYIELKTNEAKAAAYNNRGRCYFFEGKYDESIVDYTRAIEIDPDNSLYYNNRAISFQKKGDTAKERADRERANELKKQPKN